MIDGADASEKLQGFVVGNRISTEFTGNSEFIRFTSTKSGQGSCFNEKSNGAPAYRSTGCRQLIIQAMTETFRSTSILFLNFISTKVGTRIVFE